MPPMFRKQKSGALRSKDKKRVKGNTNCSQEGGGAACTVCVMVPHPWSRIIRCLEGDRDIHTHEGKKKTEKYFATPG